MAASSIFAASHARLSAGLWPRPELPRCSGGRPWARAPAAPHSRRTGARSRPIRSQLPSIDNDAEPQADLQVAAGVFPLPRSHLSRFGGPSAHRGNVASPGLRPEPLRQGPRSTAPLLHSSPPAWCSPTTSLRGSRQQLTSLSSRRHRPRSRTALRCRVGCPPPRRADLQWAHRAGAARLCKLGRHLLREPALSSYWWSRRPEEKTRSQTLRIQAEILPAQTFQGTVLSRQLHIPNTVV